MFVCGWGWWYNKAVINDLGFVQRCVNGDRHAWDKFLKKYSRLIYTYIYSVLRTKGCKLAQEDIEDIFYDIISSLLKDNYRKLKSFKAKNGCSLASWLRQVALNFTLDYLRKAKPKTVSLEEENNTGISLKDKLSDDNATPVIEVLGLKEKLAVLKECIQRLEINDKYFVELFLNRRMDPEALARHFRVTRAALDMRRLRIVERLRDCFKSKDFELDL